MRIAITAWRASVLVLGAIRLTFAVTGSAQSFPRDYPQWRGTDRDGGASAFSEPARWPEALTRRWRVEVGEGYATALVVGKTVYTFTRQNGNEVITALNAETGRFVWRADYPAPYKSGSPAAAHGAGPKATPLFLNGKLFTLGISGIVSAFDADTGKLVWQKAAPPEHPFFGTAVSPIGERGVVIVHPGNYGPLTAFDANTGGVKWTAGDGGVFASPIIAELEGTRQVITMTQTRVIGVALADGTLLWSYPCMSGATPSAITPIVHGNIVIVSGQGMGVTALKPTRRDGTWVADIVWQTKDVSLFLSNPVLILDTLFGLSERASGQYFALDANTGKVLWVGPPRQATNTAVTKAGRLLFLLNDNAELIVAKSSRSGFSVLKRYRVADSATWAQPAISGNRIFVKDVQSIALWTLN